MVAAAQGQGPVVAQGEVHAQFQAEGQVAALELGGVAVVVVALGRIAVGEGAHVLAGLVHDLPAGQAHPGAQEGLHRGGGREAPLQAQHRLHHGRVEGRAGRAGPAHVALAGGADARAHVAVAHGQLQGPLAGEAAAEVQAAELVDGAVVVVAAQQLVGAELEAQAPAAGQVAVARTGGAGAEQGRHDHQGRPGRAIACRYGHDHPPWRVRWTARALPAGAVTP